MAHANSKTGEPVNIRIATPHDYESMRSVFEPYVLATPITFEVSTPCASAYHNHLKHVQSIYPCLVATCGDTVVGFAFADLLNERGAYAWNAELSIYLAREFTSQGTGRRLIEGILALLELQGIRNAFSLITLPNTPSERLHLALGFEHLGTQRNAGYKCGSWHDVGWFQKALGAYDHDPKPVVPFHQLPNEAIAAILVRINDFCSDSGTPLSARSVDSA